MAKSYPINVLYINASLNALTRGWEVSITRSIYKKCEYALFSALPIY